MPAARWKWRTGLARLLGSRKQNAHLGWRFRALADATKPKDSCAGRSTTLKKREIQKAKRVRVFRSQTSTSQAISYNPHANNTSGPSLHIKKRVTRSDWLPA